MQKLLKLYTKLLNDWKSAKESMIGEYPCPRGEQVEREQLEKRAKRRLNTFKKELAVHKKPGRLPTTGKE